MARSIAVKKERICDIIAKESYLTLFDKRLQSPMLVNFLAGVTSFLVAAGDDFSLSHTGSRQAASAFLGDVGFWCRRQQKRKKA